jgi:hypothetical protein
MNEDADDMQPGRTISDADARAIAKALFAEATKQILMATGRGVWSTLKVAIFPIILALIIWWASLQGRVALPSHNTAIH